MIKYYYNFDKFTLSKDRNRYVIKYNNRVFYLEKVFNLDEVIDQYNLTKDYDNFYRFIANKDDSIITYFQGNSYVLLEDTTNGYSRYNVDNNSLSLNVTNRVEWREIWIRKSDYIEYYYSNIVGKYKLIDESIDYYLGMLETAIYYLYDYGDYKDVSFIVHKYFDKDYLYNPLNLKADVKERDFAEYLKYIFFSNEYLNINVEELIIRYKDYYNYDLVLARMLYPNYYFDLFDRVILLEESENELYKVISRNKEYEVYLKRIGRCVATFFEIKNIDWL